MKDFHFGRFTVSFYANQRLGVGLWHGTLLFDCSVLVPYRWRFWD